MIPDFVRGSIAPVFTVFDANGGIDETGQRNLLDFLVARGGVSACFVRSGMGQMYAYGEDDVRLMTRLATGHLRGRVPVLVGCSGIWDRNRDRLPDPAVYTEQAVALCRYAEENGADAVVLTIPEGLRDADGSPEDITVRYFETVSEATRGPIVAYQPPNTDPDFLVTRSGIARLAAIPRLSAIKVSTKDAEYLCELGGVLRGTDMALVCGCETVYYAAILAGARGVIGQGTTINPHLVNEVAAAIQAGDADRAMRAQRDVNRLCRESTNPVAFFLRYVSENGYPTEYHARAENNPYVRQRPTLTDEEYARYKALYEEITGKPAETR